MEKQSKFVPAIKGQPKRQSGYKLTQSILNKIDNAVKSGEFPNNTAVVEAALREFFDHKEMDQRIRAFLESEEGKELVRKVLKEDLS